MKPIFRSRNQNDTEFVFKLFYEHKVIELKAESWPESLKLQMMATQFKALEKSFAHSHPNSEDHILVLKTKPLGRVVINRTASAIELLYLAILSEHQSKGFAQMVLKALINESDLNRKSVLLKVTKENPAVRLYKKLGFTIIHEDAIKYTLTYEP